MPPADPHSSLAAGVRSQEFSPAVVCLMQPSRAPVHWRRPSPMEATPVPGSTCFHCNHPFEPYEVRPYVHVHHHYWPVHLACVVDAVASLQVRYNATGQLD